MATESETQERELSYDAVLTQNEAKWHAEWMEYTAPQRAAANGRTKLCNICRMARVPLGVHACEVCY